MDGIFVFGFVLVLGLVGVAFVLPIVAFVRAGRAARLARQSEKNAQEMTGRLSALEQEVLKLTKVFSRMEDLERQIYRSRVPSETTAAWRRPHDHRPASRDRSDARGAGRRHVSSRSNRWRRRVSSPHERRVARPVRRTVPNGRPSRDQLDSSQHSRLTAAGKVLCPSLMISKLIVV